jgi:tyrosine-protein phosphatase YwqE
MIFSLFKRKKSQADYASPLTADMHSHLLPGIDDGAADFDQSIALIQRMVDLGYKKLIMTPHVMGDFYKNTPEIIFDKLDKLSDIVKNVGLEIELGAAAEYYLDESFMERLQKQEQLLTFGDRYVLFETSFMNPSPYTDSAVFQMQSLGYRPVLAHPERYTYFFDNPQKLFELHEKGVLLQVNLNSLVGYYSKPSKLLAEKLIAERRVSFLGSDCHGERHLHALKEVQATDSYRKALGLELLNHSLLA